MSSSQPGLHSEFEVTLDYIAGKTLSKKNRAMVVTVSFYSVHICTYPKLETV